MARKHPTLTRRERKFLKYRAAGSTLEKAAIAAGYSPNYAQQAGSQAMERIREKAPELFTRVGLDNESYILKHLVPLLEATGVKVFCYNGKPIYSRPLPALNVRARMVELIADLKGLRVKEQEKPRSGIKVLIVRNNAEKCRRYRQHRKNVLVTRNTPLELTENAPVADAKNGSQVVHPIPASKPPGIPLSAGLDQ